MKIDSTGLHFAVLVESLYVRNSKLNTAILIEVSVAFLQLLQVCRENTLRNT